MRGMEEKAGDTANPKRPWFRFSMSTAVMGMVAAGMLMGANSCASSQAYYPQPNSPIALMRRMYGFPFNFYAGRWEPNEYFYDSDYLTKINRPADDFATITKQPPEAYYAVLAINVFLCVGVVFGTCALFEWLIRRRSARRRLNTTEGTAG